MLGTCTDKASRKPSDATITDLKSPAGQIAKIKQTFEGKKQVKHHIVKVRISGKIILTRYENSFMQLWLYQNLSTSVTLKKINSKSLYSRMYSKICSLASTMFFFEINFGKSIWSCVAYLFRTLKPKCV